MSRRPRTLAAIAVIGLCLGVGACTAGEYEPTPLSFASPSPSSSPSASPSPSGSPSPSTTASPSASTGSDIVAANCLKSYAPTGPMPPPGRMPAGTTMRRIQDSGHLVAGVSADSLLLGARNPVTNEIEGFDIDLLHAVSQAIFGDPNRIQYRVITALEREARLKDNSVDIVARLMTITCRRWANVAFSTEYYRSGQKILVRTDAKTDNGAPIKGIEDLAGKKVCAAKGTSGMDTLVRFTELEPVGADTHTDCLVLFQRGAVDAIISDDTALAGLAAQDPYAEVVKAPAFTAEPYGLAVNHANVDFVRFLNGVLEQVRADGRWTRSYDRWLAKALGKAPTPPEPVYGRSP